MIEPFRGRLKMTRKSLGWRIRKGLIRGDSFSFIILYPLAIREEFSMVVDKELLLVSEKSMNIGGDFSPPMFMLLIALIA